MSLNIKKHFVSVIQENQRIINSLCRIYYPAEEDRKDTQQDILLQLWKSFPSFRNEARVSTWIYKVALNTILSKSKKANRGITTEAFPVDLDNISHSINADDELRHLQQVIQLLNAVEKAIVILYLEGYNHREIAATLSLTETNVSTRFNRIKIRLRKMYKTNQHHEIR